MFIRFRHLPEQVEFTYKGNDYRKVKKTRAAYYSMHDMEEHTIQVAYDATVEISDEDATLHSLWKHQWSDGRKNRPAVDKRTLQRRPSELSRALNADPSDVRALEIEQARIARKRVMLPLFEAQHRDDLHPAERKRIHSRLGYLIAVNTYNTFVEERELEARRKGEYPERAVTLPFEVTANMPLTVKS